MMMFKFKIRFYLWLKPPTSIVGDDTALTKLGLVDLKKYLAFLLLTHPGFAAGLCPEHAPAARHKSKVDWLNSWTDFQSTVIWTLILGLHLLLHAT